MGARGFRLDLPHFVAVATPFGLHFPDRVAVSGCFLLTSCDFVGFRASVSERVHFFVVFDLYGYSFLLTTCDSGRFRPFVSERVNDFAVFSRRRYPFSLTICDLDKFRPFVSVWGYDSVVFGRYGCALLLMTYNFAGFGLIVSG